MFNDSSVINAKDGRKLNAATAALLFINQSFHQTITIALVNKRSLSVSLILKNREVPFETKVNVRAVPDLSSCGKMTCFKILFLTPRAMPYLFYPVSQKTGPLKYLKTTSLNSSFINDFWQRGPLVNYLINVGENLDVGSALST